jgi:hypothetical protein
MEKGVALLEKAPVMNEKLSVLLNLGRFIVNTVKTGLNAKNWHLLKMKLFCAETTQEAEEILDGMENILKQECENAKNTIPLVEKDSRLGWEPSMLYMTDKWHIEWKLRHAEYTFSEIDKYRESLVSVLK